jgi:hypothetical protein
MKTIAFAISLTVLSLILPLSLFSAEKPLTRDEINQIVKGIGSGVESWSGNIEGNMQQPLQGDKPLTGLGGKPFQTDGQTIDAALPCAQTTQAELVKATARLDGTTGRYAVSISTNIEGRSGNFSATVSGLCPDNGYAVCSTGLLFLTDSNCKGYQFVLAGGTRIKGDPIEAPSGCLCLDRRCGGSAGVTEAAVAKEVASISRSLIAKAYPHLVVSKEEANSNSYAYYISQEPTCGSKAIVELPSNNINNLNYQARALRSLEIEDNESAYSLTMAMDQGKEEAKLNEDYQTAFKDLRKRTDEGLNSVDITDGTMIYTDKRLTDTGEWIEITDSVNLADIAAPAERKTCVVSYAVEANAEILSDGSTTNAKDSSGKAVTEIVRETRFCENDRCPINAGETIVSSCSFINGNQGQVISALASLGEIKDDLKCGGKDPSESANCNIGNITLFNGESHHCSRGMIDYGFGSTINWLEDCCKNEEIYFTQKCKSGEAIFKDRKEKTGLCFQIGDDYCSNTKKIGSWPFRKTVCTQRREGYCCFKSKLARIIQQQGRPQVAAYYQANRGRGSMDPYFGSARNPDCRGFTPTEFQVLDFSKIDLKEFFGDIKIDANRMNDQLNQLNQHQQQAGWRDNMEQEVNDDDNQRERMEDAEEVRQAR